MLKTLLKSEISDEISESVVVCVLYCMQAMVYESFWSSRTQRKKCHLPTHSKGDIGRSVDKEKPLFYRVKICSIVVLVVFFFAWRNFFCTFFSDIDKPHSETLFMNEGAIFA